MNKYKWTVWITVTMMGVLFLLQNRKDIIKDDNQQSEEHLIENAVLDETKMELIRNIIDSKEYNIPSIKYSENGVTLQDSMGNVIFGPCKNIVAGDFSELEDEYIFRYIDNNGLVGYGKVLANRVETITHGIYNYGSKMACGSALVQIGDDLFYIDTNGQRFTDNKYIQAYPFSESQGLFARTQKADGTYCIISRKEEVVLDDFDYINTLPDVTMYGTGIKDGKAVIFSLDGYSGQPSASIEKIYPEFVSISEPNSNFFAIVTDTSGNLGAICIYNGKIILEPKYSEITWSMFIPENEAPGINGVVFTAKKLDGTYDVIIWKT